MGKNNGSTSVTKSHKTVGKRIMTLSGLTCLVACIIVAVGMVLVTSTSLTSLVQKQMKAAACIARDQVEASLDTHFKYLEGVALNPIVYDSSVDPLTQKQQLIKYAKSFGANDMGFAKADGKTLTADLSTIADIQERAYFKSAISGQRYVSNPFEDSTKPGTIIMMFSIPVYANGDPESGNIVGVLYMLQDGNYLSNITNSIKFGDTGYSYMTDAEGTNIANPDADAVLNAENAIKMFAENPDFASLIDALHLMMANDTGTASYTYKGVSKTIAFATIPEFSWHVVISVEQSELFRGQLQAIVLAIIITVIVQIIALLSIFFFTERMVSPIKHLNAVNNSLSEGDLTKSIDVEKDGKNGDEIGQMVNSMDHFVNKLKEVIRSTKGSSITLHEISDKLKEMSNQSEVAAESVCKAVEDVTQATIAQATEVENASTQVGILEEAVNSIGVSVAELMNLTEAAMNAEESSTAALEELIDSNIRTTTAFNEISEQINATGAATNKISEAADLITQIASQTNLLSLNASIEAARAGDAGKGFAVVATEIQQLSIQSNAAANTIQEIINELMAGSQSSIKKMEETLVLISDQSERLKRTEDESSLVGSNVSRMRESAVVIRDNLQNCENVKHSVNDIITNLSAISEENAASSEETNASMEELNANIGIIADSSKHIANIAKELNDYMAFWLLEVNK